MCAQFSILPTLIQDRQNQTTTTTPIIHIRYDQRNNTRAGAHKVSIYLNANPPPTSTTHPLRQSGFLDVKETTLSLLLLFLCFQQPSSPFNHRPPEAIQIKEAKRRENETNAQHNSRLMGLLSFSLSLVQLHQFRNRLERGTDENGAAQQKGG